MTPKQTSCRWGIILVVLSINPATAAANTVTVFDHLKRSFVNTIGNPTHMLDPEWLSPAIYIPPLSQGGMMEQAQFAVAAAVVHKNDGIYDMFYGSAESFAKYDIEFHMWSGGFQGGGYTYFQNPRQGDIVIKQSENPASFNIDYTRTLYGGSFGPVHVLTVRPQEIPVQANREYVMTIKARPRPSVELLPYEWVMLMHYFERDTRHEDLLAGYLRDFGALEPAQVSRHAGTRNYASSLMVRVPEPGSVSMLVGAVFLTAATRGRPLRCAITCR